MVMVMSLAVILAVVAAICIGTGDFVGGIVGRRDPSHATLMVTYALVFAITLPVAVAVDGVPGSAGIGWGAGMGVLWPIGIFALVRGIAFGRVVVVIPVAGVLSALVPVIVDFISGSRFEPIVAAGVIVGVVAVGLTGLGHDSKAQQSLAWSVNHGAVGGITTGFSLVMMNQAADSGLWPLVAAALTATVLMVIAYSIGGRSLTPVRNAVAPAAVMGLLVAASFVALMFAFPLGSLTVVSVVASQYPAATILLASLIWGQRPRGIQYAGVALTLLAVGLIAGG
jgi:drug/metabolite transporter (DMT)-like permease